MWSLGLTLPKSPLFKCKTASDSGTKLTLAFQAWMLLTPALVIAIPEIESNCRLEKHHLPLSHFALHLLACLCQPRDSSSCHNTGNKPSCCHGASAASSWTVPPVLKSRNQSPDSRAEHFRARGGERSPSLGPTSAFFPSKCYHYLCSSDATNEIWRGKSVLPQITQDVRVQPNEIQAHPCLLTQRCRVWVQNPLARANSCPDDGGVPLSLDLSLQSLGCRYWWPSLSPRGWVELLSLSQSRSEANIPIPLQIFLWAKYWILVIYACWSIWGETC